MSTHTQQVVQKLWNYCNILRDDGMSYGDYVEQLTRFRLNSVPCATIEEESTIAQ